MSRFYSLFGTMIFLVIGGDAWTLRGLGRTFQLVPLTEAPRIGSLVGGAEQVFSTIFTSAVEIAAPVLAALLITDVAFGVVSRVVPQMNVFAVGFPTKVAVALLVVCASLPFVSNWISGRTLLERGLRRWGRCTSPRSMAREERTEKATPRHRKRAREQGQVARSADLSGSLVLVAGLLVISFTGPAIAEAGGGVLPRDPRPDRAARRARRRPLGSPN